MGGDIGARVATVKQSAHHSQNVPCGPATPRTAPWVASSHSKTLAGRGPEFGHVNACLKVAMLRLLVGLKRSSSLITILRLECQQTCEPSLHVTISSNHSGILSP